jgi:hypothetical protein
MAFWRLIEGAAEAIEVFTNWRLYACVFAAIAIVFAVGKAGTEVSTVTYVIAAFGGFVAGAAWEFVNRLTNTR